MTLKNRIALIFTVLTSVMLAVTLLVIYLINARYTSLEFYRRLQERAKIAAQVVLEQDEMSQRLLEQISRQHLLKLPDEKEFLLRLPYELQSAPDLPDYLNRQLIEQVFHRDMVRFSTDQRLGIGLKYIDNEGTFAIFVIAMDQYGQRKLQNLRQVMFLVWIAYLLIVFFLGRWYAQKVLHPISELIQRMQLINTTNLHMRLPEEGKQRDELHQLKHTFNRMLDRLATSVEAQKQFISNASHQLKNPLTAILGEVENAQSEPQETAEIRQSLTIIEEEARRLEKLILQLLHLAHASGEEDRNSFTTYRLDDILFDLADHFNQTTSRPQIKIDVSSFPDDSDQLIIRAQPHLLRIALTNVLENALKFSGNREVQLSMKITDEGLLLCIRDQGIGIPADEIRHIFDPFFRAKNAHHLPGFGIGLPLVQKIMQMHGGRIEVDSRLGEGTVFFLYFPL